VTRPVRAGRSSTSPYSSCEEARSNRPPAAKHDLPRATFHRLQLEQEPRSKGHRFLAMQSGQLLEIMRTLYSFLLSSFVSVFCVFVCALHSFFHFVAAPFTLCFPFGIVLCIRKARTPRHPLHPPSLRGAERQGVDLGCTDAGENELLFSSNVFSQVRWQKF